MIFQEPPWTTRFPNGNSNIAKRHAPSEGATARGTPTALKGVCLQSHERAGSRVRLCPRQSSILVPRSQLERNHG